MGSMKNWMLAAAVVVGAAGLGATAAQAAEFGFRVHGPVAYIPPCPGPGYVWINGYMANGYWVDGYWNLPVHAYGPVVRYDHAYNRDWDRDRRFDRDRDFRRDGDRFRR
jgi:hypothetical protein